MDETWSLILREECRLRVLENRVLKIFGPKMDEVTRERGSGEDYETRSFMLCVPHQILFRRSNSED